MTRKKWTTPAQEKWLKDRFENFIEADKDNKTRLEFFKEVNWDWCKEWPIPDPQPEDIAAHGSADITVKAKPQWQEKRIKAWFHNKKRLPVGKSSSSKKIMKLKKPKMWQWWQAYGNLTYESKWKAQIGRDWAAYTETWKAENPDILAPKTWFEFQNAFLKEKYEQETKEMKLLVEEHRDKMKKEEVLPPKEKNALYQLAINQLPHTVASFAEALAEQTGWQVTIMVGGPEPRQNGQISSVIYHQGLTKDGQNFHTYLGHQVFEKRIVDSFDDFLHASYSE
ncbi:hypothetical protein JOM56_003783, partial [Amanita muscaria]